MPTQCSRDLFGYEVVEGREVVAAFDGGEGTTDAGGLLLGATDRTIHRVGRFAACFVDHRAQAQVEHTVAAMVAQRAGKGAKELADELETAYRGVIKFLEEAPDDLLTTHATAGGHKDLPMSDIMNRMVVLHGLGHVYSVYASVFFAK